PKEIFEDELAEMHSLQAGMKAGGGGTPEEIARHRALEDRIRRLTWAAATDELAAGTPEPDDSVRDVLQRRILVECGVLDGAVFAVVQNSRRTTIAQLGPQDLVDAELEKFLFALRVISRAPSAGSAVRMQGVAEERVARLRELLVEPLRLRDD